MEKVEPTVKRRMWEYAYFAPLRTGKINQMIEPGMDDEYADLYVNCNPYSSWEDIAVSLYHHHQVAAVEEVRSYLPPRGEPGFARVALITLLLVHLWIGNYLTRMGEGGGRYINQGIIVGCVECFCAMIILVSLTDILSLHRSHYNY